LEILVTLFYLFGLSVQVKGAIAAIRYTEQFPRLPAVFEISGQRDADLFDLLEYVFGFQVCAYLDFTIMFFDMYDSRHGMG
jgi:hypothetical protein